MFSVRLTQFLLLLIVSFMGCSQKDTTSYSMEDYARVEKIDIHVHLKTENPAFVGLAKEDRFRFLNIAVHSADGGDAFQAQNHLSSAPGSS